MFLCLIVCFVQDALVQQGALVRVDSATHVRLYARNLTDGDMAVALFNPSSTSGNFRRYPIDFKWLNWPSTTGIALLLVLKSAERFHFSTFQQPMCAMFSSKQRCITIVQCRRLTHRSVHTTLNCFASLNDRFEID
jgi:hypothetical protein